jgi:hypothetical protein
MKPEDAYEAPVLEPIGKLGEMTQAANLPNGDVAHGIGNAFS